MHAVNPIAEPASAELRETTVLVVAAATQEAEDLASILRRSGYTTRVAMNGPDALSAAHAARPDLLIVEADLGDITGEELQAALTIDKRTSGIPLLLIRARGKPAAAASARGAPPADCIGKPFAADEVLARVATQLELASLRGMHKEQTRLLTLAMQRLSAAARQDQERAQELRTSRGQIKTLIDNLPGLAYRCRNDADWTMEFLSDGCLDVTGYAPADLLLNQRLAYAELIHPEDSELVRAAVAAGLARREPYEIEYRIRHRDGTERWVWERGCGIYDDDGRLVHLDGLILGATDRKRTQQQLALRMKQLESTQFETVKAIANMTELRDPYTARHERQVASVARAIAAELGLSRHRCHGLEVIGMLHDIGKVAIPLQILSKPSSLTEIEYEMVKMHPQTGCDILRGLDFPWPVAAAILQHHERLDGSGYPQGLKGDQILLEARIVAVADVVTAMSSHRPYRPTLGVAAALEEITSQGRDKYDQQVARACARLFREGGFRLTG